MKTFALTTTPTSHSVEAMLRNRTLSDRRRRRCTPAAALQPARRLASLSVVTATPHAPHAGAAPARVPEPQHTPATVMLLGRTPACTSERSEELRNDQEDFPKTS